MPAASRRPGSQPAIACRGSTTQRQRQFESIPLIIVQDLFDSPLWRRATFQLPGGGYAERSGSYVNYNDQLQSFKWAIRPPAGAKVEGHLYWQLLAMRGMYNPRAVLDEVAGEIGYFAAASGPIPPTGIDLKVNLLADVNRHQRFIAPVHDNRGQSSSP